MFLRSAVIQAVILAFVCAAGRVHAAGAPAPSTAPHELSDEQTQRFLSDISDKLGSVTTLRADFVQERRMAAFIDPLTAKGTCFFMAPQRIRWELKEPYRSALLFNDGKVAKVLYEDGRPRRLEHGSREVMRQVLRIIALWMRGDFDAAKEYFDTQVLRDSVYRLRLTPRGEEMAAIIRTIELAVDPESKRIRQITIREARDDQIVITFVREEVNIALDEALFAVD
ncbi:MAG: outer membrane lipoprotein carrier protein LolA [Phycisphaerae bacterium]